MVHTRIEGPAYIHTHYTVHIIHMIPIPHACHNPSSSTYVCIIYIVRSLQTYEAYENSTGHLATPAEEREHLCNQERYHPGRILKSWRTRSSRQRGVLDCMYTVSLSVISVSFLRKECPRALMKAYLSDPSRLSDPQVEGILHIV